MSSSVERHNYRMQASAGVVAVLNNHVGRSPAAPDAERYTYQEVKDNEGS